MAQFNKNIKYVEERTEGMLADRKNVDQQSLIERKQHKRWVKSQMNRINQIQYERRERQAKPENLILSLQVSDCCS